MTISIVAAKAQNGVIGYQNKLPWNIPSDLARFKRITRNSIVIMGRKTHESIGRALPQRLNIVVSRSKSYSSPSCVVAHSIADAIRYAEAVGKRIFVIGGAQIYQEALPLTNVLYLTTVHMDFEGDVVFPQVDLSQWRVRKQFYCQGENHPPYTFEVLTHI